MFEVYYYLSSFVAASLIYLNLYAKGKFHGSYFSSINHLYKYYFACGNFAIFFGLLW